MKPRIFPVIHVIYTGHFGIVRARYMSFKIQWDKNHTTGEYPSIPDAMKVIAWRNNQLSKIKTEEIFRLR